MTTARMKDKQNIIGTQSKDLLPALGVGASEGDDTWPQNESMTKSSAGRGDEGVGRAGRGGRPKPRTQRG